VSFSGWVAVKPRILVIDGPERDESWARLMNEQFETVRAPSIPRAVALLQKERFDAVCLGGGHLREAIQAGRLMQNDRILEQLPDGVVLLDHENVIHWSNGRLREWTNQRDVVGMDFYQALGCHDIPGPELCPLRRAFHDVRPVSITLKACDRYFQLYTCPLLEGSPTPTFLLVQIHDITQKIEQQKKLVAIHGAGLHLADLQPEDLEGMSVESRVELLKQNILHYTRDMLKFDVIEIRLLDPTGKLVPLLAHNMSPEAAQRILFASSEGNGVTGNVAYTGRSKLCNDTELEPLYLQGALGGGRSSLTVPLKLRDEVVGTFNVESTVRGAFTEDDRLFLEIFSRDVAAALHTLELLVAEQARTISSGVEAIHREVARPIDDILNDAVMVMEQYIGHDANVVERLRRILQNARDIKNVIQEVGRKMAPSQAVPFAVDAQKDHPGLRGRRVLVVDEDHQVRKAAHTLLERYACIVETAHNGQEAMNMVTKCGGYDAIIADIRLPDFSGYQLLLKLREILEWVPLILMTGFGYDANHSMVNARRMGLQTFLYKPFRIDQLLKSVENVKPLPGVLNPAACENQKTAP